MKLGLVLPDHPQYSETFFVNKITGLLKKGHEVIVFAPYKSNLRNQQYKVVRLPRSKDGFIQLFKNFLGIMEVMLIRPGRVSRFYTLSVNEGRGAISALKMLYLNAPMLRYKLDWVHFGFATTSLSSLSVAKAIGAKMAVSVRGFDICIYPLKHPGCFDDLWSRVDKLHSISDDLTEAAYRNGFPKEKTVVKITPAISADNFKIKPSPGSIQSPVKLLSVGRLHWKKGFGVAIDACRILHRQGFKFEYTIIGEGIEYDRLLYNIVESGLEDFIFLRRKLPHNEVASEMEKADIYLQPSIQEGFCNSVLEAQSKGLLCIVSDAEGLPENVGYSEYGWVFPKYDYKALAGTIINVCGLPAEERKKIAINASKRVKEEFSLEQQIEKFVDFYTEE